MPILLKTDLNCNIGCVRQRNEDMILLGGDFFRDQAQKTELELSDKARFAAIVADGMGGHKGGQFASEFVCNLFSDFIMEIQENLSEEKLKNLLKQWAQKTHEILIEKGYESAELKGMGTTFCGLFFYEKFVFLLNIGDSRAYRFRNGILKQLSTDHSMRQLTGDSSMPSNQIYNSLGAGSSTFIDIKEISEQIFDEDIFLICSDGLCDMIGDTEIEQLLESSASAEKLVDAARNAGGKDNISVVLLKTIRIEEEIEEKKEAMPRAFEQKTESDKNEKIGEDWEYVPLEENPRLLSLLNKANDINLFDEKTEAKLLDLPFFEHYSYLHLCPFLNNQPLIFHFLWNKTNDDIIKINENRNIFDNIEKLGLKLTDETLVSYLKFVLNKASSKLSKKYLVENYDEIAFTDVPTNDEIVFLKKTVRAAKFIQMPDAYLVEAIVLNESDIYRSIIELPKNGIFHFKYEEKLGEKLNCV